MNYKHGKGKLIYKNGAEFDGNWNKGKANGHGTLKYPNGDKYVGEWQKGYKKGRGIYYFASGAVYDGMWNRDKKHGKNGEFKFKNNDRYAGSWKNGKMDGSGNFILVFVDYLYQVCIIMRMAMCMMGISKRITRQVMAHSQPQQARNTSEKFLRHQEMA